MLSDLTSGRRRRAHWSPSRRQTGMMYLQERMACMISRRQLSELRYESEKKMITTVLRLIPLIISSRKSFPAPRPPTPTN